MARLRGPDVSGRPSEPDPGNAGAGMEAIDQTIPARIDPGGFVLRGRVWKTI